MTSWIEISGERLRANYRILQQAAGPQTAVLAVLKANAYGHGSTVCAPVMASVGAEWLGVGSLDEGLTARGAMARAGIEKPRQPRILLMCGHTREHAPLILHGALTPVVWRAEQVAWLAEEVRARGAEPLAVHVEIDTGMTRQGARPGAELADVLQALHQHPELRLEGVMTHFASSEVAGSPQTSAQQASFEAALAQIAAAGFAPEWIHAGNTSSVDVELNVDLDGQPSDTMAWLHRIAKLYRARPMVRTGIALHGYCLPMETAGAARAQERLTGRIQPVMTWKTRVLDVSEARPGDAIGYNGTFVANTPMRLALLGVGYADGLRRELSSTNDKPGGWVMIHGQRAPIVGRISMNLTTVDVTGIDGVAIGDEAVVLGEGVTAEDHARLAGTVVYEIVCGVRPQARLV